MQGAQGAIEVRGKRVDHPVSNRHDRRNRHSDVRRLREGRAGIGRVSGRKGGEGTMMDIAYQHQLRIARDTLRMPDAMAAVMGGMTKAEATEFMRKHEEGCAYRRERRKRGRMFQFR
jgi:hypothetical protein